MKRLWVEIRTLSRRLPVFALGIAVVSGGADAWSQGHEPPKVRFVEHAPAAFDAAQREGKPVFLLISAVWCYWCKYFQTQVLADAEVAVYLNRHYVNMLADHDRRPDLARKYVRGLPMIVLFGPDGGLRQSFVGVLKKEDFLSIMKNVAVSPPRAVDARPESGPSPAPVTQENYQQLREEVLRFIAEYLDTTYGGFGTGDKYPQPRLLAYLLELHQATGDPRYLLAVEKSLEGILGALYDPVDGGFFRFAEGRQWRVPHSEKLVHLNAALAAVLWEAHRVTRNPRYRETADRTVAYLLRTLHDATVGGFFSSQSADPAYYRLAIRERRATQPPPVNREKLTAWNAETAMAFLALSQSSGRKDLRDVALKTLDFISAKVVTEKGAFSLYEPQTGQRLGEAQVDANAWAALGLLEGYRAARVEAHRRAALQVLSFAVAHLFDAQRGAFGEAKGVPLSLDANGVMAEALVLARQVGGPAEYADLTRRVLTTFGGSTRALLAESDEAAVRAPDAVYYLRAYAQIVARPPAGEERR